MNMHDFPTVYTDEMLPTAGDMFSFWRDYQQLVDRLHGDTAQCLRQEDFLQLLRDRNELLVFVVRAGQLVSTAHASLAKTPPSWHVYINNVVTHDDHEGQGYGRQVLDGVCRAATVRWGENGQRPLRFTLTNSPEKGNAGFYEALGFTARTKENRNETVVWTKGN